MLSKPKSKTDLRSKRSNRPQTERYPGWPELPTLSTFFFVTKTRWQDCDVPRCRKRPRVQLERWGGAGRPRLAGTAASATQLYKTAFCRRGYETLNST